MRQCASSPKDVMAEDDRNFSRLCVNSSGDCARVTGARDELFRQDRAALDGDSPQAHRNCLFVFDAVRNQMLTFAISVNECNGSFTLTNHK